MWTPWSDQGIVGIFWDYENVPLRQKDGDAFLEGLKHFIQQNNVKFTRLYCHEKTLPAERELIIREISPFDINFASISGPNAVDRSLIQSCINVLQDNEDINHVVILTGDVEFRELLLQLKEWDVRVTLICQEENYSPDLVDETHPAYPVSYIAEFPTNWWMTLPQSEFETIQMTQYSTDADKIQQIIAHLDPSKPYSASASLTALIGLLDHAMRNPTAAESLKAEITPALARFKEILTQKNRTTC